MSYSNLESIVAKNKPKVQFEAYETKGAHYPVMGIYIGVSRSDKAAISFHLDPRVKPEDDKRGGRG